MKNILLLISLVAFSAFILNDEPGFDMGHIKKNFVKVKKNFYVSRYEVTNQDYRSFLYDVQVTVKGNLYQEFLPDTTCWLSKSGNNQPYLTYYFRYPSYNEYPVVGISYNQAKAYCGWLTNKYNADPKRKFKQVNFRLLYRAEWIAAAQGGDSTKVYTWGSGFIKNNRNQYLCNFKKTDFKYDSVTKKYIEIADSVKALNDRNSIAGKVNSFYPNSFGLYNFCGNVAEMIQEKGIAKGGGYNDPAYEVRISSEKTYTKPQADIGFRVAMQVVEE